MEGELLPTEAEIAERERLAKEHAESPAIQEREQREIAESLAIQERESRVNKNWPLLSINPDDI